MGSGFCAHPGGRFTGCPPPRAATGETATINIKTTSNNRKSLFISITSYSYEKGNLSAVYDYKTVSIIQKRQAQHNTHSLQRGVN